MHIFAVAFAVIVASQAFGARTEYQVHQENKNYQAWREKAFFGPSSNLHSGLSVPAYRPPAQSQPDYSRQANDRYMRQRNKEDDAYNARVAQENARNAALSRKYENRTNLNAQALAGNPTGMRLLALDVLNDPDASEKDKQCGAAWMAEAASRGDAEASRHIEIITQARQRAQAEALVRINEDLLARAKAGDVSAMAHVGMELYEKTTPDARRTGLAFLRRAAEADDITVLRYIYRTMGRGESGEEETQLNLMATERLAKLPNEPEAAFIAGERHLSGGFGLTPDRGAAMPFLLKAVNDGYTDANLRIAEIHDKAIGGPRDVPTAIEWYRKALPYEHPEFGISKQRTRLSFSRLLLEPANNPQDHAQELLQLWDDSMLDPDFLTKSLALLAADALASGVLGREDPNREMFYLSRALSDSWAADEGADYVRISARFGTYVLNHAGPELRIVVKEGKTYTARSANQADGIWPYCLGTFNAPGATVEACLAAAYTALNLPNDDLKTVNQFNCAVSMFDSIATRFDDATAWYESGRLVLLGKGVDRDAGDANDRLLKAWAKGSPAAALLLATIQQKKLIPNATDAAAEEWIKQGALKNDGECMRLYGVQLLAMKNDDPAVVAQQKQTGVQWLKRSADAGNVAALDNLADSFEHGEGVTANDVRAVELLTKAAAGGSGPAKRKLATRMAEGRGVLKDPKAGLKLMHEAAQTDVLAAGNLGVVLWRGDWGEKTVEDGLDWMEVALERGFWQAGRNLAKIYHLGLGVPANEEKAQTYLDRAAKIGGRDAAMAVAEMYAAGEVITKDNQAAARWRATASQMQGDL